MRNFATLSLLRNERKNFNRIQLYTFRELINLIPRLSFRGKLSSYLDETKNCKFENLTFLVIFLSDDFKDFYHVFLPVQSKFRP